MVKLLVLQSMHGCLITIALFTHNSTLNSKEICFQAHTQLLASILSIILLLTWQKLQMQLQ